MNKVKTFFNIWHFEASNEIKEEHRGQVVFNALKHKSHSRSAFKRESSLGFALAYDFL